MKVGFTGTQKGMSEFQSRMLRLQLMRDDVTEFHHGDCIGADAEAAAIAHELGIPVVIHPPIASVKRAFTYQPGDQVRFAAPYLVRNHEIVDEVDFLIAAPRTKEEELRSGTWATIRYAQKVQRDYIILVNRGGV